MLWLRKSLHTHNNTRYRYFFCNRLNTTWYGCISCDNMWILTKVYIVIMVVTITNICDYVFIVSCIYLWKISNIFEKFDYFLGKPSDFCQECKPAVKHEYFRYKIIFDNINIHFPSNQFSSRGHSLANRSALSIWCLKAAETCLTFHIRERTRII